MRIQNRIEAGCLRFLGFIFDHRIKAFVVLVAALIGYSAVNIPKLQRDGRVEAFMHADDPALLSYYRMRREFGQDNRLVVSVSAPDIFDTAFLEEFSTFHREIAAGVPYISEIFSLYNIPFIQHEDGGLYLEELVRNMLARGRDPADLRDRITSTPLYRNFVISDDGKTAAIVVEPYRYAPHESDCVPDPASGKSCEIRMVPIAERTLLGAPQYVEMTRAARAIAKKYDRAGFRVHIAGAPVVSTEIVALMSHDMPRFTGVCVLITMATMFVLTRSVLIAFGAFLTFFSALFSTLATVSVTGIAMTPPTQLLIPMTLVVGLCTYVHFTSAVLRAGARTRDRREALATALARSHTPILFTALTTAGGLFGFLASPLAPIAALGLFGAVSTGLSYLLAMIWATLIFRVLRNKVVERRTSGPGLVAGTMARLAVVAARRPWHALSAVALVLAVAATGLSRLDHSHNSLLWLPPDNAARLATEAVDAAFMGSVNLEVVVTPPAGSDFRNEALLKRVESTARDLHGATDVPVGRHTSIISFIEETNQALNDGDPAMRTIPGQDDIWDQLLLLEGQGIDDMKRYVSMDYGSGRISFQTPWLEATRYTDMIETVGTRFAQALGPDVRVETTGLIALLAKTSKAVLDSMSRSYLIALMLITVAMCLALRSVEFGVASMVPNVAPFLVLLGIMGGFGLALDTFTILIGGIITGLIVDDTLHFFFHMRRNLERGDGLTDAVANTLHDIGGALFTTTIVVMLGFSVFILSSMSNVRTFGLLMVTGAGLALVSELVIGPAVLAVLARRARRAESSDPFRGAEVKNAPA